jgi:hypothetical protein
MSDVRRMLGAKLAEVLDTLDADDDSASVRIEITSGNAIKQAEGEPSVLHVWTLTILGDEWQGETHEQHERAITALKDAAEALEPRG